MLPYYGKTFEASQAGLRVAGVICDKCSCEYFYDLNRIGSGAGTAPYGIGQSEASRAAQEKSEIDLRERLAGEAELVPCPHCHWINDELLAGYRLTRYRSVGRIAFGIGLSGSILSLVCAWYIFIGPLDHWLVPYLLYGGPIVAASLAVAMLLFRSLLRGRIRPNRLFPEEPRLPLGTPPALLLDDATGQLRPAKRGPIPDGETFDFQFGRHNLPDLCSECMQPSSPECRYPINATRLLDLQIPRCADCAYKIRTASRWIVGISAAVGLLAGGGIADDMKVASVEWWLIILSCLVLSAAVAGVITIVATARTGPVRVVAADRPRGILRLRFRNREFAQAVADVNDSG